MVCLLTGPSRVIAGDSYSGKHPNKASLFRIDAWGRSFKASCSCN
jgi:hypothetical protein